MTIISHRGYFYNNKRCRLIIIVKGEAVKRKSTKKKTKKRASRKKRRKIKLKHDSQHKLANLQQVMSFKFPPFKKAYESFWDKRKKEKG